MIRRPPRSTRTDTLFPYTTLFRSELVRLALGEGVERHHLDLVGHAPLDLGPRHAILLEAEGDVLLDVHVREERVGLEHHVHGPLVGRHAGHVLALQQDGALAGRLEAGQHAQQRGLAAARGAEQREELAPEDVEGDVVDGDEVAETLGDADNLHVRLLARIVPWRPALAGGRAAAARGGAQASGVTPRLPPPLLVPPAWPPRSEEHTSELQSLMRISYAVFCLKNKQ